MNILVIFPHWLGDFVLATSVLHTCLRRHPQASITVVARPDCLALLKGCPAIQHFIPLDRAQKPWCWVHAWRQLVGHVWDQVWDLRGSGLGFALARRSHHLWKRPQTFCHRIEQYQTWMGSVSEMGAPRLWLDAPTVPSELAWIPQGVCLIVAPTANSLHKEWGIPRFKALLSQWLSDSKTLSSGTIILVGAPSERERVAPLFDFLSLYPNLQVVDAVGRYDLGVMAALCSKGHFFIGNDSGPMHLAAALGVPTLGLFGPTPERIYGPWPVWGDQHQGRVWTVRAEGSSPETTQTMEGLSVAHVYRTVQEIGLC